jgi:hypothetical protein
VPDWRRIVSGHLAATDLNLRERNEVIAELAAHLEEVYAELCARGVPNADAIDGALAEVADWRALTRRIERAKRREGPMNHRTKTVWIPGLVSLTVASGSLALLQVWGARPHIVWTRSGLALMSYIPWLVAQPAFGAIGAYISRQNGGDWRERLTASVLPAAGMVAAFCASFCTAIALNGITSAHEITFIGLSFYILSWAALPGLTLALGALPFLGKLKLERVSPLWGPKGEFWSRSGSVFRPL